MVLGTLGGFMCTIGPGQGRKEAVREESGRASLALGPPDK